MSLMMPLLTVRTGRQHTQRLQGPSEVLAHVSCFNPCYRLHGKTKRAKQAMLAGLAPHGLLVPVPSRFKYSMLAHRAVS